MKKVIALYGTANTGKSSTIKFVYDLLRNKYPNAKSNEIIMHADIKVFITVNNKKIGIESQGDPISRLGDSLKYFVSIGCNVIICATRTRGRTVDAVNELKGKFEIKWIKQDYISDISKQNSYNTTKAKAIIREAEMVINE